MWFLCGWNKFVPDDLLLIIHQWQPLSFINHPYSTNTPHFDSYRLQVELYDLLIAEI